MKDLKFITLSLVAFFCLAQAANAQSHYFDGRIGVAQFVNKSGISLFDRNTTTEKIMEESLSAGWIKGNNHIGVYFCSNNANLSNGTLEEYLLMTSLGVEFRHFEAITEKLSLSDGLRLVGVTSSTTLAMGNWEDDYRRWGALVCFSVGLKWNISPRTAWEVTYELKGGAMLSDEYSTPNPNVTLPAPGNKVLFGQCLTIGATTSF